MQKHENMKRSLLTAIADECATFVAQGLPQEKIVEALESALRCEKQILAGKIAAERYY